MKNKLVSFIKKYKKFLKITIIFLCIVVILGVAAVLINNVRIQKQTEDLSVFFEEYKEMHITTDRHRMMYYTKRASVNPNEVIDIRYMELDDAEKVLKEYHEFGRDNRDILFIGFRDSDEDYIEFSSGDEGVTVEITFPDKIVKRENIIDTNDTLKALRIYWTLLAS